MLQHQTNSQNNLTFLKSNYKYKRRDILTMRALPACEARTPNQLAVILSKTKTSATSSPSAATPAAAAAKKAATGRKCSTILSLFIGIIWKALQALANCLLYAGRIIANANDHEYENEIAYMNVGHDHDVNASVVRHLQTHSQPYPRITHAEDDANDEVSTAREQQQQQQQQRQQQVRKEHQHQQQHLSSSSPQKTDYCMTTSTTTKVIILPATKCRLPLMTLLIALMLSMRLTSAGTCWQTHLGNGKCSQLVATNFTKSDCCGKSQTFSYTDRELSSVEHFFATAIGGGVECVPCIESCKGFKCGPNKKCVKRKGRPKCVCAPECGATLRRKHQQHQQHHNAPEQQSWAESSSSSSMLLLSPMPQRGLRSLSSGITITNLGWDGAKRHNKQQSENISSYSNKNCTDNQRNQRQREKPMLMPKRASHRRSMLGEPKHRRLLIIDSSNLQEQPTTRRLQMGSQSAGKVQMEVKVLAPLGGGSDRRRHRKNNNNSNSNSNNNGYGKHLTRSMTTLTSATAKVTATGAIDSSATPAQTAQSRHKLANANEPANDNNSQQQQQQQQQKDNAPARVRHQHQQHAPNHEQQYDNGSQQQQQQRRHKHKHNHKDKLHTKATGILLTANTTMSGSGSGARRRLYITEHGSETATSSGTSSSSSSSHRDSHLANTDDLTFLSGIYEAAPVSQQQQQQQQPHSNPVCGNDGRTYNTECQLRKRACRTNNAQLEVAYRGHCKTSCNGVQCRNGLTCVEDQYMMPHCITCKIDCPWDDRKGSDDLDSDGVSDEASIDEEQAVCGVDGKTYRSTCDINRMICQIGRSIAVAYPGPCRADHITCADIKCRPKDTCLVDLQTQMPRCVSCRYKCSRKQQRTQFQADKICGHNNHTYSSWCEMRKDSCATGYFIGVRATGVC